MGSEQVSSSGESLGLPGGGSTAVAGGSSAAPVGTGPSSGAGSTSAGTSGSTSSGGTVGGGSVSSSGGSQTGSSGSSTSSTATSTSTPTGSASTKASTDKSPIQLGFIVTKVSNIGQFNVSSGQTLSDQQIDQALVNATNKAGGLNGRKIVPVFGVTDTAAENWSSEFQAACAGFTQDHHVAAVVGYIFVYLPSFESCLAKAGVPHLYGGYQPGDVTGQRQYPTLVSTTNPSTDVHYEVGLQGAVAAGLLTAKTKLGMVLDTCAGDDQAFNRVGAPYLKAHHISYLTFTIQCGQGSGDDGKEISDIASAELHFRTSNVSTVFVEGPAALFFALSAQTQNWHPQYLMTAAGAGFEGNLTTDQLKNFHGFGWQPSADVDPTHQPYAWTASEKRCLALLKSQNLTPHGYNDFVSAFTTCDGLALYAKALAADGGQTAASPVVSALATVIPKTQLASVYGGTGRYSAEEHGGPSEYREWGFSAACTCIRYEGPARSVP
jgi:hypothetical protein